LKSFSQRKRIKTIFSIKKSRTYTATNVRKYYGRTRSEYRANSVNTYTREKIMREISTQTTLNIKNGLKILYNRLQKL